MGIDKVLVDLMRSTDFGFFDAAFIAMAHRGGARFAANIGRENTLHAFRNAVQLGYRYIETDVQVTCDGTLVIFHDDRLDRVSDARGAINNHRWAQLAPVRIGGKDPIPRLSDVFEEFPETRFNIDLKSDATIEPMVAVLNQQQAWGRVCIASFSVRRLQRFSRALGRPIALSTGTAGVAALRFIPVGSRWISRHIGCVLQVPVSQRVAGVTLPILTPALMRRAHKQGAQVHVWTVDDAEQMNRLIDLGVDGLISDRIDVLAAVLRARKLWPSA